MKTAVLVLGRLLNVVLHRKGDHTVIIRQILANFWGKPTNLDKNFEKNKSFDNMLSKKGVRSN